ncbi:hypothetical protein SNE40_004335 [Patella caerulea]|uniref:G-protein coupled receptors family 1 profile domain-containing protein n=1 Tax=Patella caerulea TaxID=87958 RepID=A0AAN8K2K8_PATCE
MIDMSILNRDTLTSCVLNGIIAFVGLLGNALMLRALIKYDRLRLDVYVIFGGLALADMLHLCFAVPAKIMDTVRAVEVTTDSWCKVSRYVSNATAYVAAYHIVVLSVLRGIVLTNRGNASPTAKHATISSGILWTVALLASTPVFFTFQQDEYTELCAVSPSASIHTAIWLEGAFGFFLPMILILFLYFVTHYVAKRYFSDSYSLHARKMSRLINAIVIAFCICQLPYQLFYLYLFYEDEKASDESLTNPNYDFTYVDTLYTVSDYLYCLLLADRCIRPVLYSKLASDLGDCFDEVINCTHCNNISHRHKSRQKVRHSSSTSQAPLTGNNPDESREEIPL